MKHKLLSLAESHRFTSNIIGKSVKSKYSIKKDDFYLLWLHELQHWFKNIHNIHVYAGYDYRYKIDPLKLNEAKYIFVLQSKPIETESYDSYEKALEASLIEAFKLL